MSETSSKYFIFVDKKGAREPRQWVDTQLPRVYVKFAKGYDPVTGYKEPRQSFKTQQKILK